MSEIAIRVENLGKQYRIGTLQHNAGRSRYGSLRESVANAASASLRAVRSIAGDKRERKFATEDKFWALKDVSFDIKSGEVVGVIGRNGAGKSTLLKVLSRITEPTTGRVEIRGRVGSLLEVGTGFHPELTGRDNVYLNGAILGMRRAEIDKQFDAIVAFAEVERFIDTPVKRYSSGMYLRLAFAVAAHLEPEILIVDEVLAVGDHRFQERCLGKMHDVAGTGRTVLFVSHNMSAIQRLCCRALLFSEGRLRVDSHPSDAVNRYLDTGAASTFVGPQLSDAPSITKATAVVNDASIDLSVQFKSPFPLASPVLGFVMYASFGTPVFGSNTRADAARGFPRASGGSFSVTIPAAYFRPGRYTFSLWLGDHLTDYCILDAALQIHLDGDDILPAQRNGSVRLPVRWRYSPDDSFERTNLQVG